MQGNRASRSAMDAVPHSDVPLLGENMPTRVMAFRSNRYLDAWLLLIVHPRCYCCSDQYYS